MTNGHRLLNISLTTVAVVLSVGIIWVSFQPVVAKGPDLNAPLIQQLNVKTSKGTFAVSVVSFDRRGSWKLRVDTANDGLVCGKKCFTKAVGTFVKQRRALAGINGTYFLKNVFQFPAYNSYTKKKINYDHFRRIPVTTLAVDTTNRPYLYLGSVNGQVGGGDADILNTFTFESKADGGSGKLQALLANTPALAFPGMKALDVTAFDEQIPLKSKTTRSGIGWNGKRFYLFVVKKASMNDASLVARAMKLDYALGMDGGGSSSLVVGSRYVVGPGRAVPNVILIGR